MDSPGLKPRATCGRPLRGEEPPPRRRPALGSPQGGLDPGSDRLAAAADATAAVHDAEEVFPELSGERRHPETGRYRKVRPDARGRLLAETLGVYFSISASGDDLVMEDAETGEVLRKPVAESRARRAAERQAAEEAEARAVAERQAAAEAQARRAEAEARAAAEATVQELLAKIQRLEAAAD